MIGTSGSCKSTTALNLPQQRLEILVYFEEITEPHDLHEYSLLPVLFVFEVRPFVCGPEICHFYATQPVHHSSAEYALEVEALGKRLMLD